MRRALLLLAILPACGGGSSDPVGDLAPACNPLGGVGCVTPWPSSVYQSDDGHLAFPLGALPANVDGVDVEPALFAKRTGFSAGSQIFTVFPEGVDDANLVFHDHIEDSIGDASPTVLVDIDTGERVAHFAELDANAAADGELDTQALFLRPAARLAGGHHYAVGIRTSLKARGGGDLARPAGFQAALDGASSTHPLYDRAAAGALAAVAALETAGISRDDLVVAWDFTVADDDAQLADTRAVRDAAIAAIGDGSAITYTIDGDGPGDTADIARKVLFHYGAPAVADDNGLHRDGSGTPIVMGSSDADGVLIVPACATAQNKAGLLVYGHGFFGNLGEVQGAYPARVARDLCMVLVGGVWRGMSSEDLSFAAGALNDANKVLIFGERILQGFVDLFALETLARTRLASEVLVDGQGQSIVDPSRTYFYGISQGAILGASWFYWDPNLTRAVTHVGGADWSLLFERSTHWPTFKLILGGAYPGDLAAVIEEQLLQMGFDPTDPANIAPMLLGGDKHLLLHMSEGDAQVSNLASYYEARSMGLPLLSPSVTAPYGLTATPGPLTDAFVTWTEEPTPLPPETNLTNPDDNVAHGQLRKRDAVVEQIGHFFATGEVIDTCGGVPCDCAQGACGALDPP